MTDIAHAPSPIQYRLFVLSGDRVIFTTEYSRDKDAVCEACDQFNGHKRFGLVAHVVENRIQVRYNGHLLVTDRRMYAHPKATPEKSEYEAMCEILDAINGRSGKGMRARIDIASASDNAIEKSGANNV